VKKKQFTFIYDVEKGEQPESFSVQANNITNAKAAWNNFKCKEDVLLMIFCGKEKVWES
jgi:hypothetical protein